MVDENVIRILKEAYVAELETVINYTSLGLSLKTFDGREVADDLQADVADELGHAERVGKRLRVLGERAPRSMDDVFTFTQEGINRFDDMTDVEAAIDGVIEAEQDAIATYDGLVEVAGDVGDHATATMAAELLEDEQDHLAELNAIRETFA